MKKSNWREELNTPNAVKKYALDEIALTATVGGIALWKLLAGGGLAATAYANRKRISQTFSNMFNKAETIDDLNKLDNFWRNDTKTNDTKIDDPIGDDLKGQTFKPTDTKVDGAIPGSTTNTNVGTNVGTNANVIAKTNTATNVRTRTRTRSLAKPFRLPKSPKLPGTGHNVGRRVNPQ